MNFRNLIRDFVFGMEDGLVSNLGLVLGVYVGGGGKFAIVLAGLASMFAGAFSMAAGSYLSAKSQREVYEQEIRSTKKDMERNPKKCLRQMRSVLRQEGFSGKEVEMLFKKSPRYQHPEFVCDYLVQRKVGISVPKLDLPLRNAFAMFLSFLAGSLFPIVPFILFSDVAAAAAAVTAAALTIAALFGVGWAKTIYTKRSWLKSGVEMVVVGIAAGVIGYLVGWLTGMV